MKTIIYVDGFNLYYGSLKDRTNGCFRWLDIHYVSAGVEMKERDRTTDQPMCEDQLPSKMTETRAIVRGATPAQAEACGYRTRDR